MYDPVKRRANYLKYREREMVKSRERGKKRTNRQNYHYSIKSKYGLTPEDYEFIQVRQEFKCAICRSDDSKLVVDHDHKTNIVRGLLCHSCNVGLGNFKDDEKRLASAIEYLSGGYYRL